MAWEDAAARLRTSALVAELKALAGTMKKGQFKRLVATTAAQVLAVHPDLKPKKARRWARRATGSRPWKMAKVGTKERAGMKELVGAAAVTAVAAKVARKRTVRRRVRTAQVEGSEAGA